MIRKLAALSAISSLFVLMATSTASAQGHFEFGAHFGPWSLNLLKPAIESAVQDVGEQITQKELDKLRQVYPAVNFTVLTSQTEVQFDSSGSNLGFEARWYPEGENGSFSIGLSAEQCTFSFGLPSVKSTLIMTDSRTLLPWALYGQGNGRIEANPFAAMLSFRWDIAPSARFHPYISLGLGAAGVGAWEETTLSYAYQGQVTSIIGPIGSISETSAKTLLQLKEEYDQKVAAGDPHPGTEPLDYPGIFPIVALNVGFRYKVVNKVHALIDAGVLNGFQLRFGVAVRP